MINNFLKKLAILKGDKDEIITAVPLDSRRVLNSALTQLALAKGNALKAKIIIAVLKLLNFPFLYPLLFQKKIQITQNDKWGKFLLFFSNRLKTPIEQISFSIYKAPGKFVLPIFNNKTGEVLAYAKVYDKETKERGENEARALRYLNNFSFESAEPPRLIASEEIGKNLVNIISTKEGLKNFKGVTEAHLAWIKELAQKTGKRMKFEDSLFAREMDKEMEFVKSKLNEKDLELVEYFYKKAKKALQDKEFVFSFISWDFDYYEFLRHKTKNLVVDWEYAREEYPSLFDVFSLLLSERRGWLRDLKIILRNKKTAAIVGDFLREWRISKEDVYPFFLLFLIDRLLQSSQKDKETIIQFLNNARVFDYKL